MWRNIAAQDPAFGRPDKFCSHTDKTSYASACIVTLDEKISPYIERISASATPRTISTGAPSPAAW